MSENGAPYKIEKERGSIDQSQRVSVEAPTKEEAEAMFEKAWDDGGGNVEVTDR